jgi:all-trans-retinol 13,14-reductase
MTWGRLVDPEHIPWRLRRRQRHLRYSISTLSLFMAVDMDLRAAGLDSGNIWYNATTDIDASYKFAQKADFSDIDEIPGLFFNATTLKDPTMRRDGVHTVEALSLASPDAFARWRDTNPGERPEDYEAMKAYLSDKILDAVQRFVPGLRERIVFQTLGTPLTNIHYLHATRGGMYGTENTIRNLGPFAFPVRTPIPGLFQCGASTLSPGIHGVTRSGLAAAAAALDCPEEELLTQPSEPLRVYSAEDPSTWPPDSARPGSA